MGTTGAHETTVPPKRSVTAAGAARLREGAGVSARKTAAPSPAGRKLRASVAVIYALTTVIPFLVLIYLVRAKFFGGWTKGVAWVGLLALVALGIAVLGGVLLKDAWGKLSKALETIERLRRESDGLREVVEAKSSDELDAIPTLVKRLVGIAKEQRVELEVYSKKMDKLHRKLKEADEQIRRVSRVDSVTGLYNRNYFDDRVRHEIERKGRYPGNLALAMIGIDPVQGSGDEKAEQLKNEALAAVGGAIRKCIREIDLAFRYGKKDFAVVFPETTAEGAAFAAERIRAAVEHHRFLGRCSRQNGAVSVSIGVSMLGGNGGDLEDLVSSANRALEKARSSGGNRAIVAAGGQAGLPV